MSRYDYIKNLISDAVTKGQDFTKTIPGKLGMDSSSRFDRFARRNANVLLSELENLSESDYILQDLLETVKENKGSILGGAAGIGAGGVLLNKIIEDEQQFDLVTEILRQMYENGEI